MTPGEVLEARIEDLERRVTNLEVYGSRPSALLAQQVAELANDVRSIRRGLYTFALGAVVASIVFAFSVFELVNPAP